MYYIVDYIDCYDNICCYC